MGNIENVPAEFRIKDPYPYPQHSKTDFEWYFYSEVKEEEILEGWTYLPILFTSYLKRHSFGEDVNAINILQKYVDTLDPNKKYFSICQFDYGVMVKLPENIKIFSMCGEPAHYKLPLICEPYPKRFYSKEKKYLYNFIGRDTHPIRTKILSFNKSPNNYISSINHHPDEYRKIMSESVFVLCPRGVGLSSFRIQEAIECGSIPVYISDRFFIPHEDFSYGVLIRDRYNLESVVLSKLNALSDVEEMRSKLPSALEIDYSYQSNKKIILNQLSKF